MKILKRLLSLSLAVLLLTNLFIPAFAADKPSQKEEVIYVNLAADGRLKSAYAVNIIGGGNITDYGDYSSVKILNTTDEIIQNGDTVTISSNAQTVYYQGELEDAQLPWNISILYYLDGKEYAPHHIAGQSGKLEIRLSITQNEKSEASFYQSYALQANLSLDTEKFNNITAADATIANVGRNKQLSYTVLPGNGLNTSVDADVSDFELDSISINGIRLNLNIEVDTDLLIGKAAELIDATIKLDEGVISLNDGANKIEDGSLELKDGISTLSSGLKTLDASIALLRTGLTVAQSGLNKLNTKSDALVSASSEIKTALTVILEAVNAVSPDLENLSNLLTASEKIKQAASELYEGSAQLQTNISYDQYQEMMQDKGLLVDELKSGNDEAIIILASQVDELKTALVQLPNEPTNAAEEDKLKAQILQKDELISLLLMNQSALSGTRTYLDGIADEAAKLNEGLAGLHTDYKKFDTYLAELMKTLPATASELTILSEEMDELAKQYSELDIGITEYTQGLTKAIQEYDQVINGMSSLAKGSKKLVTGSEDLDKGTGKLHDGITQVFEGTQALSDGTGELRSKTSGIDQQIDEKINELLSSISGNTDSTISFVSPKNTNVHSVQFVFQTEAIKADADEAKQVEAIPEQPLNSWQKFLHLFGL